MNPKLTGLSRENPSISFPRRLFPHVALAWACLALGLSAGPRLAAQTTITVVNPSFETPTPTTFPDYTIDATGWTATRNDVASGTFAPGVSGVTPAPIDGNQVGYANAGGGLQQVLSTAFVAGNAYTFSVYIGNRSDNLSPLASGTIELGYFDTTFHPLASQSATPALGTFNFVTGTYLQTTAPDPGQTIALRLTNTASVQVVFDRVQLTTTAIPEPSVVAAVFGGVALVAAGLWRRRHSGQVS